MTNEEEKLVTDNINMANDLAWKYCRKFGGNIPFDELQSLAYLGLTKAAKTFDAELNKTFSTYAYAVMKNEILLYWRNQRKHIQITSLSEKITDNLELQDTIPSDTDISIELENKINVELLYQEINKLSEKHKFIVLSRLQGVTMDNIGKALNISQPQVSREYQKIINMLRRKFNK